MPNDVYENPIWKAQGFRPLFLLNNDCVADVSAALDGTVIDGTIIVLPGTTTIANVAGNAESVGRWAIGTTVAAENVELRVGAEGVALGNVSAHEFYFEWRGQIGGVNPDAVAQIGFLDGVLVAAAAWNGLIQQWSVTTANGLNPPITSLLPAGVGPAGTDHRWQITVGPSQTEYRLNGTPVAVHTIPMGDVPCARVRAVTLADASLSSVVTDQILAYQPGLARN